MEGTEKGAQRGSILVSGEVAVGTETCGGFSPTQQLGKTFLNCKADRVTIASAFMVPVIFLSEFHNALLGGLWQILQPHLSQPSTLQPHRSSHSCPFTGSSPLWAFSQFLPFHLVKAHRVGGFPGGSVVKNPPAIAEVTGSIPDPGGSHMSQSNEARVPRLLSLCSKAQEPQLLSPYSSLCSTRIAPARCN